MRVPKAEKMEAPLMLSSPLLASRLPGPRTSRRLGSDILSFCRGCRVPRSVAQMQGSQRRGTAFLKLRLLISTYDIFSVVSRPESGQVIGSPTIVQSFR
jgi:hypothetical protein